MDIRTFRAKSMQEAIELVRKNLGPDAAVLHSRQVPRPGITGWFGATELEIAASNEAKLKNRLPSLEEEILEDIDPTEVQDHVENDNQERLIDGLVYHEDDEQPVDEMARFDPFSTGQDSTSINSDLYYQLITADVEPITARRLTVELSKLPNSNDAEVLLRQKVARMFDTGKTLSHQPGKQQVVSVIGPTGVGKTTTIAKLAAKAKFEQRKQVGLITVDTYRIAAVDQLRTYAEIMGLPMQVVSTPMEMREAMHQLSGCDYILIDTAGRSPRDELQIQELHSILRAASPDETYLVLSATSSNKVLQDAVERFAKVDPTAYVITKLDEIQYLGNVLNMVTRHAKPISYITNGQDVPHAIAIADPMELARFII
ncbi:MAG: flagellar biosynthesis protein FlhF [Blastopirellula sp.]|nr:MAG: flagellar biosynthesis protein FlhF [Blastopirellula sp.]